jgi:hypothetical protein
VAFVVKEILSKGKLSAMIFRFYYPKVHKVCSGQPHFAHVIARDGGYTHLLYREAISVLTRGDCFVVKALLAMTERITKAKYKKPLCNFVAFVVKEILSIFGCETSS